MKQLQAFMFAFLSVIFFLTTSCGDDEGLPNADAGSGKVTANVGGQSWESKDEIDGAVYAEAQGTHQIQAYHEDGSYLGLTIFGSITTGTTIETTGGIFQGQYKPDFMGSELFVAAGGIGSGSITFTNFSESKVKGTFQFTGAKANPDGSLTELEVVNGTFDIDL